MQFMRNQEVPLTHPEFWRKTTPAQMQRGHQQLASLHSLIEYAVTIHTNFTTNNCANSLNHDSMSSEKGEREFRISFTWKFDLSYGVDVSFFLLRLLWWGNLESHCKWIPVSPLRSELGCCTLACDTPMSSTTMATMFDCSLGFLDTKTLGESLALLHCLL